MSAPISTVTLSFLLVKVAASINLYCCCLGSRSVQVQAHSSFGVVHIRGVFLHEAVRPGTLRLDDVKLAGPFGDGPLSVVVKEPVLVDSGPPIHMKTSISSLNACQNGSAISPAALQLDLCDAHGNPVSLAHAHA